MKNIGIPKFLCENHLYRVQEITELLKDNLDPEGLQENYLDGHGFDENNRTVFRSRDGLCFCFDVLENGYGEMCNTPILPQGKITIWNNFPKFASKMRARF